MQELKPKKSFKSIIAHPIKVEMQPIEHKTDRVLSTEELQQQIEEARKGTAKVDSKYVGFELDERGHLFEYKFDYIDFLSDMSHIIKNAKERKLEKSEQVYKNSHRMIIQ
jgi:DNA gyrase/topoisomerase IV subunit A